MRMLFAALLLLCLLPLVARADQQWLLMSDLHLNPYDRTPNPSFYGSDTNWALFESTLAEMRQAAPDARVVIIAGDFLTHHFGSKAHAANARQSTADAARATMTQIERQFAHAFPHAQFLIVLGNNDDPCGDYVTAPNTPYLQQVARIWEPLVNRNGAAPRFAADFSHAGYYTAQLPSAHLRAIALDDAFWSIAYRSCGRGGGSVPQNQLTWYAHMLSATAPGTRNIVIMHIPPGTDPVSTLATHRFVVVPYMREDVQGAFLNDTQASSDRIAFAIAGHLHMHDFRTLGGVPLLMSPAVSPIYNNNPGFVRMRIAPDGLLKDYQLYNFDIWAGEWTQSFAFDDTYHVSSFDLPALLSVHKRIGEDEDLRARWIRALVADSPSRRVNGGNWRAFWCAQEAIGGAYARCAGDQRRAAVLPVALLLLCAIAAVGLGGLIVRLASQRRRQ